MCPLLPVTLRILMYLGKLVWNQGIRLDCLVLSYDRRMVTSYALCQTGESMVHETRSQCTQHRYESEYLLCQV